MKVLLCGGGNAIHVLCSYIAAQGGCEVVVLTLYPGEAEKFRGDGSGIKCTNDVGGDVIGKAALVTADPAETVKTGDIDVMLMALPSQFHESYMEALKPHLKPGVIMGAMPGQAGFDLCCRHIMGDEFCDASSLFSTETLPWACRIADYGKHVEVLGTKQVVEIVIAPKKGETSVEPVRSTLQKLIGPLPVLKPASSFLVVTLMNPNSIAHPSISYAYFHDKDTTKPMDEAPLYYSGATDFTGEMLDKVSDEVLAIKRALIEKYPNLALDSLIHIREWLLRSYADDIVDKTNTKTMLNTNKGYQGLVHPLVTVEVEGKKKYLPNFKHRYYTEDLPCGLLVTRGIAELAGVATPEMDKVIQWCQKNMDKDYLVDGKLTGKDIATSRAPQRYGYKDFESFVQTNRYVV